MEKYDDRKIKDVTFTKYKIVVPTERDRNELIEAFEHIHYSDIDTNYVAVNQLSHEYLTPEVTGDERNINNIIVDEELYKKLKNRNGI